MRIPLWVVLLVPGIATAQSRDAEIRLARSAAPAEISKDAKVYVLDNNHYVIADPGHSGEACMVGRTTAEGFAPMCGDAEADATALAQDRYRTEQRLAGKSHDEIERSIDEGYKTGRFHAPKRPALVFMISSSQLLTDPQGKPVGRWMPHLMVYFPSMKEAEMGLVSSDDMNIPNLQFPGTPNSQLIVVARDWRDGPATEAPAQPDPVSPVPTTLPRADEIRLARSAAPAEISKDAKVYVLDDGHYIIAEQGTSGVACMVVRSTATSLEPQCGDTEADATVLSIERYRTEQRLSGRTREQINADVNMELQSGRFRTPARPSLVFMQSASQVLTDPASKVQSHFMPHVMMYYPYMTNSSMGLAASKNLDVPGVTQEGTPMSALIFISRDWTGSTKVQ